MLSFLFIGLIIAGAVGYVTRSGRPSYNPGHDRFHPDGQGGPTTMAPEVAPADARADAGHWVDLLGAGLSSLDGVSSDDESRQRAARYALSDAAERHTAANRQLAQADSVHQIELAGRTALEGLHYLRAARTALGLDPGPEPAPADPAYGTADSAVLTGRRRVVVQGQEYEASGEPGQRTPYYYPGGTIRGRQVPSGWYSTPWWKTALVAGAAGMGSLLVMDALLGHGGFGHGGFGGGPMDQMSGMGGGMDGGGFLDGDWF